MLRKEKLLHSKKKSLFKQNRDEIHARLEINSDMYEKIRRQQTELSENGNPLEVDEISLRHCQWNDHR